MRFSQLIPPKHSAHHGLHHPALHQLADVIQRDFIVDPIVNEIAVHRPPELHLPRECDATEEDVRVPCVERL